MPFQKLDAGLLGRPLLEVGKADRKVERPDRIVVSRPALYRHTPLGGMTV
jgi:hypothetical protein